MKSRHAHFVAVVFACACVALAAPAALAQPAKPKAEKKLTKAQQKKLDEITRKMRLATLLINSGDYSYAVTEVGEVLKLDKKHLEARRLLATAELRLKQYDKAVKLVEALAKEDPKDYWAVATRAELYEKMGDRAKSLQAFEALAERKEAPPLTHFKVAMLLDDLRQKGDAAATAKVKQHLQTFLDSGNVEQTSEGKQALRVLLEIEHGPMGRMFFDSRESYFMAYRSGGYWSRNSMTQAEEGLKKVLQLKPGFQPAHFFLGMCYASVKSTHYDLAAAERELRKAPDVPEAWFFLGRMMRDAEKYPEAAVAFENALRRKPHLLEAGYQLGLVYKALGRKPDAIHTFEKTVLAGPNTAAGSKSLLELQAIAPTSFVTRMFMGRVRTPTAIGTELFSTERFRAGIDMLERFVLGGVEEGAEAAWLEKILRRIVETNDLSTRVPFRVKIAKTRAVNACAVPNGNVYFTRGFLDFVKKQWPKTPLDENNSYIAGVMAHELTHVVKGHVVNREMFMKAMEQAGKPLDPGVFVLTTRLTEIEADREGMIYTTVAGYQPDALVQFLERMAREMGDIPPLKDHPTFEERVQLLSDFWTNEVRYAYQAFETGTAALEEAKKAERLDARAARAKYEFAMQEYDRFVRYFPHCKEVWNNLGVAQAKLGVMDMAEASPLSRWYTPLSVEKHLALKLPKRKRELAVRGAGDVTFLVRAKESLKKSLAIDPHYGRAMVNLAAAHVGLGENRSAVKVLADAERTGVEPVIVKTLQGIAAAEQQQWVEAIAAFDKAASMPGATAAPLFCLGQARLKRGDPAGAAKAFTRFIQVEGRDSAWSGLAEAALRDIARGQPAK